MIPRKVEGLAVPQPLIGEALGDVEETPPTPEFPPGLVGDIAQYVMQTARYPNAPLALGAALAATGKLCDRRIAGPTGSTTVLYIAMLGQTGVGKQRPLEVPKMILAALGKDDHIGPGDFASVQAVQSEALREPFSSLALLDEMGILLSRLVTDHDNPNSSTIPAN